ncbi:hypothetical protein C7999DRAFT_33875 [Corynascus novoguineensis]|uniref:Uncharacterized protein n=1 Tax=Corynascus novoguineensis TaxID=1126955 RepID=A0AAN7HLF4_9PEZI|nr:hypothetical protein C7999DRAFT_33875 [Corynascus novoguineensis]
MFIEGGGLATRMCIPKEQNSQTQGTILSDIVRLCNLKKGDKVLVHLVGGCRGINFRARLVPDVFNIGNGTLTKRKRETEATAMDDSERERHTLKTCDITPEGPFSDSSSSLLDPHGDGSLTYVGIPLGELERGHYDLEARFPGQTIVMAEVLNQYGDVYAGVDNPTSSERLIFDIEDDMALSASLIAYTVEPVNMSFSGTVKYANPANQSSATTQIASWSLVALGASSFILIAIGLF